MLSQLVCACRKDCVVIQCLIKHIKISPFVQLKYDPNSSCSYFVTFLILVNIAFSFVVYVLHTNIIFMQCLMGGAYFLHSPALYDDLPVVYTTWSTISNRTIIFEAYEETGINCFIAAGLYLVVFVFSFWQYRVNKSLQAYTIR
uniref:Ribonuclease kappa-B n=1 Tax=Phallusia mammillata TaxID=59560 RepID=A0A6F9DQ97_9ASCI|nr:ribonuclease kappa-B [Phallusia mammillata]